IADIKSYGPNGLVFTLHSGNVDFPYVLSDQHLTIAPEGTNGAAWDEGIGTGGYVLQKWEPGVRAQLKKKPYYWKPKRAHFDAADILNVADPTARTTALISGDMDVIVNPDLKTINRLKADPGVQIIETASNGHISMPMLTDVAPFNNNDIRLA